MADVEIYTLFGLGWREPVGDAPRACRAGYVERLITADKGDD